MKPKIKCILLIIILCNCQSQHERSQAQSQDQVQAQQQQQQQSQQQQQQQQQEQRLQQQQTTDHVIPEQTEGLSIHDHLVWDQILNKYVSETGQVDYAGIKEVRSMLGEYLQQLKENPVQNSWSRSQKLAYWINAYNAFTVDLILDHYPVESIRDISRPWGRKFIQLGDKMFSLNQIEHKIIRPVFKEPRIHFALVCAAVSCPKLLNSAYLPETLDQQLEAQTEYFINKSGKNQLSENHVKISQLFNWYGEDFKRQGSIPDFLNKYADIEISVRAKIEFLKYDWSLND